MFESSVVSDSLGRKKKAAIIFFLIIAFIVISVVQTFVGCPHFEPSYEPFLCSPKVYQTGQEVSTDRLDISLTSLDPFSYKGEAFDPETIQVSGIEYVFNQKAIVGSSMTVLFEFKGNLFRMMYSGTSDFFDFERPLVQALFNDISKSGMDGLASMDGGGASPVRIAFPNGTVSEMESQSANNLTFGFYEEVLKNITIYADYVCSSCYRKYPFKFSDAWTVLVGINSIMGTAFTLICMVFVGRTVIAKDFVKGGSSPLVKLESLSISNSDDKA